jgi:hypothetical protein
MLSSIDQLTVSIILASYRPSGGEQMKFFANVVFALVLAGVAQASDRVAVYALVDKVVMEPNADKPEQIQVWDTKGDIARNEWADFKSIAGKREAVGFGNRYMVKLRVRKADEKPKTPDIYQVELGLVKIQSDTDYGPVKALFEYPSH